jgi:hypothetical protein
MSLQPKYGVPDFRWDERAVRETAESTTWWRAVFIDGELRWATRIGIGDLVDTSVTYNMRQLSDHLLLSPKEETTSDGETQSIKQ